MARRKKIAAKPQNEDAAQSHDEQPDEQHEAEDEPIDALPPDDATLIQRIMWVRERVRRLGKDSTVRTGRGQDQFYKAISHDKITAYLRPKMNQAGIFCYPTNVSAVDVDTGAVTERGRRILQHQARYKVHFVNVRNERDTLVLEVPAYADDYGDKGPGKAMSYAVKYALLKMFMIETGEDDEERVEGAQMPKGGRVAVLSDSEQMMADLYALADELFGADANKMLKAMAKRRFFVDSYALIPQDRFADAERALRTKHHQMAAGEDSK